MKHNILILTIMCLTLGCTAPDKKTVNNLNRKGCDGPPKGEVKMIPIDTPKGTFHVWTKRIGNNTTVKVLLLHGDPGASHRDFEAFDSYFPAANIEYYHYDQLGSLCSDQPDDPDLWEIPRFVHEVE